MARRLESSGGLAPQTVLVHRCGWPLRWRAPHHRKGDVQAGLLACGSRRAPAFPGQGPQWLFGAALRAQLRGQLRLRHGAVRIPFQSGEAGTWTAADRLEAGLASMTRSPARLSGAGTGHGERGAAWAARTRRAGGAAVRGGGHEICGKGPVAPARFGRRRKTPQQRRVRQGARDKGRAGKYARRVAKAGAAGGAQRAWLSGLAERRKARPRTACDHPPQPRARCRNPSPAAA